MAHDAKREYCRYESEQNLFHQKPPILVACIMRPLRRPGMGPESPRHSIFPLLFWRFFRRRVERPRPKSSQVWHKKHPHRRGESRFFRVLRAAQHLGALPIEQTFGGPRPATSPRRLSSGTSADAARFSHAPHSGRRHVPSPRHLAMLSAALLFAGAGLAFAQTGSSGGSTSGGAGSSSSGTTSSAPGPRPSRPAGSPARRCARPPAIRARCRRPRP